MRQYTAWHYLEGKSPQRSIWAERKPPRRVTSPGSVRSAGEVFGHVGFVRRAGTALDLRPVRSKRAGGKIAARGVPGYPGLDAFEGIIRRRHRPRHGPSQVPEG